MRTIQVAVVGGGPAGLGAATAAARAGASTILLDEQPELGGRLRYRARPLRLESGGPSLHPAEVIDRLMEEAMAAGVSLLPGRTAWGLFEGRVLGVADETASFELHPDAIILATGSTDLPRPMPGGCLPGVMSSRAVQLLIVRYGVLPGQRVAIVGGGDEASEVAALVEMAGGDVVGIVDAGELGLAVEGDDHVGSMRIADILVPVDLVVIAVGRQPDLALAQVGGVALVADSENRGFVPVLDHRLQTTVEGVFICGDAAGPTDVETVLHEGQHAGISAAASLGLVDSETIAADESDLAAITSVRGFGWRRQRPHFVQAYR